MGNLARFLKNGLEFCMFKFRNMFFFKKKMVNGDRLFGNWNVIIVRGKVKSRNFFYSEMIRYFGMKMCRKKEG